MSQLFTELTAEQESTISGGNPPCWAPAHGYRRKDDCDRKEKEDKCKVIVICPPRPCPPPPPCYNPCR